MRPLPLWPILLVFALAAILFAHLIQLLSRGPPMSDLSDLFETDPYALTKDDPRLRQMVDHLRAQRHQFAATESRGERPKAAPRATKAPKAPSLPINLDELDL